MGVPVKYGTMVRFLITARKEPQLVQYFEGFESIDLDVYAEQAQEDLRTYYHTRLDESLSKFADRDEFIEKLVQASENIFTYAECISSLVQKYPQATDIQSHPFLIKMKMTLSEDIS